ncbi:MAG: restriction endonuclease subunit S [Planctomycetaceae bacterium]
MTTWKTVRVSDLGNVVTGRTPPSSQPEYFGDEYPFITPTDMGEGHRHIRTERFLSESGRNSQVRTLLPVGSACFCCIGSIGKTCLTARPSFTNQQINSVVVDRSRHDSNFVYYLLRTLVERVQSIAGGAATPIVNKSAFSGLEVQVPDDLTCEQKIASVLGAYDELIENNRRRIEILEEMTRRLYREWFVQFRFPGHAHVPLGKIPKGWEVRQLEAFGEIITGKTPSKQTPEFFGGYMPFIKLPDMHGNIFCLSTEDGLSKLGTESQRKKTIPASSLCVSCIGTAGIVTITSVASQTNQQINSIVLRNSRDLEFLYFTLVELKETIVRYGATGATMTNLNRGKFAALEVVCPSESLVAKFQTIASPVFEQILNLQRRNANLQTTRDLLLPRLISGELDVSELPIEVEEAARDGE